MVDLHGFQGSLKSFFAKADSQCFVSGFMVLTIFALFAPDLDLLLGTVQSQHALSYLTEKRQCLWLFFVVLVMVKVVVITPISFWMLMIMFI